MNVVEKHGHTVTRRFRQSHISRNDALEDLRTEKAPKVGGNLFRERGAIIVHGKEDPLDSERWIDRPSQAHERIEQLRYALKGKILTLYGHQDGVACGQGIDGKQIE